MASTLSSLLGPTLVDHGGSSLSTDEALAGARVVGIYFSAHWCPPCKAFTPVLSRFNTKHGAALGLKLVFATNDESDSKFKEYFNSMELDLALPFKAPAIASLSSKYGVKGIPTLVFIDAATGELITTKRVHGLADLTSLYAARERRGSTRWRSHHVLVATTVCELAHCRGREGVSSDPEGTGFPYREKSVWELLDGAKGFTDAAGATFGVKSLKNRNLGLYFSASWCGPCVSFTPQLVKWYAARAAAGEPPLEIVFVSSDRDEASFKGYLAKMPWKALAFADRATKTALSELFDVEGIPTVRRE